MRSVRCVVVLVLAAIGMWLTPSSSEAQQAFTLTVPVRLPTASVPQTARVKMAFTTATSGTVTVGGTNVTCAAPCNALGTFGPGGADAIQVKWISATSLEVTLTFSSDFTGNFCSSTRGSDRTISLSLAAGINASDYRMASYTVPEIPPPAGITCLTAPRRVSNSSAFLTQTSGTTAANNHRLPVDVTLVLDKSGSMSSQLPGGSPGTTRFARLTDSIAQFMALFKMAVAAGVEGSDKDRVGLIFFDSTAQGANLNGGSSFKERGASSTGWDDAAHGDIISAQLALPQFQPNGSTSIGGGISTANTLWTALANKNDNVFIVFTDGEQNTSPCINSDGLAAEPSSCSGSLAAPLALLHGADPHKILRNFDAPMLTIGLGTVTDATFLDQIARETAGHSVITTGTLALDLGFADQLVQALKGNTISLISREIETMPTSGTGTTLTALADGSVKRVVFVAGWDGIRSPRALSLKITDPNGATVVPVASAAGQTFLAQAVDIPASGPIGEWKAQVTKLPNIEGSSALQYHLSAYAVEGALEYRFTVRGENAGTDVPVVVRAEVAYNGKPLDNLPVGSLKVTVERPGENAGTILHGSSTSGTPQNEGGKPQSAASAKVDALGKDLLDRIEPKPLPTVLSMNQIGPGVYEAQFDQTTIGGQYRFRVDMNWNDPRSALIKRVEKIERQVPVLPTAKDSVVAVAMSGSNATIQITPRDRFGNYVGPGYESGFVVTAGAPATVGAIADPSVNGTYVIPVANVTSATPIAITYNGQSLRNAPLSDISSGGTGLLGLPWWVWILLLVVIVILLVWWLLK